MYVLLENIDADSRIKTVLSNLVKGQESQENCLKDIMEYISGMRQKVESHATVIKHLEQ